jgi:hypothetical protein
MPPKLVEESNRLTKKLSIFIFNITFLISLHYWIPIQALKKSDLLFYKNGVDFAEEGPKWLVVVECSCSMPFLVDTEN